MKISAFIVGLFLMAVFVVACSSGSTSGENKQNARSVSRANANTDQASSNANTPATIGPDGQNAPANASENPLSASRNKKIEAMRNAPVDPNAPKPDIEEILRKSTRPAPENSEFSVALTDILVERRRFPKHPVLSVVEKVTQGDNRKITITLRDGRRLELAGNAIEGLSIASTATILKAAGLESPPPPVSATKPNAPPKN